MGLAPLAEVIGPLSLVVSAPPVAEAPEALAVAVAHLKGHRLRDDEPVEARALDARVLEHVELVQDDLRCIGAGLEA